MKKLALLTALTIIGYFSIEGAKTYGQVPGIPMNLRVTADSGRALLSWDSVPNANSYNLYLSRHPGINNSNYTTKLGMQMTNVISPYQITGLNNGVTYYFAVTAVNSSGEGAASDVVAATPQSNVTSPVLFQDISQSAGLLRTMQQAFGNPVLGDIDNDGNLDIVDPHHNMSLTIYQNNGNETFRDISATTGIAVGRGIDRHGLAMGDYDNDGNLDIFVGTGNNGGSGSLLASQLYKGNGSGLFTDVTAQAGLAGLEFVRAVNWVDYDNDGHLDLVIARASGMGGDVYKNNGSGAFVSVTGSTGLTNAFDTVISFADYDNDGYMDLAVGTNASVDRLYHNNRDGTFSLNSSFEGKRGSCRGLAWGDYNNDGFIDLFVSKGTNDYYRSLFWDETRIDFSYINFTDPGEIVFRCSSNTQITFDLYISGGQNNVASLIFIGSDKRNPSSGVFTLNSSETTGRPDVVAGRDFGFFIWKENTGSIWHVQWTKDNNALGPGFSGHIVSNGVFSNVTSNSGGLTTNFKSFLYRNNGNGTFTDVTEESFAGHIGNNTGAAWGDFDNDGYLDLYVTDAGDVLGNRTSTLYRNLGNGKFEDITASAGVGAAVNAVGRHYGAAWGDFNNDGMLDLLLSNGFGWGYRLANGRTLLYRNPGNNNNWIKLKLAGTKSNRSGIGARVVLRTAVGIQSRQLNGNGGEVYSQGVSPLHFGLGNVSVVDDVTVFWPSGIVQTMKQISANQEILVIEPDRDEWTEADNITLWSVAGSGANPVPDFSNYIAGASSISSTRIGTGWTTLALRFPSPLTINQLNTSLDFQVFADGAGERLSAIRILAPNWNNRFVHNSRLPLNDASWTRISLNMSDFIVEEGAPSWNRVSAVRMIFTGGAGGNDIKVDQLFFNSR